MHRHDFQQLSRLRVREARILLRAGAYEGAYYLLGYAVECALKACIARRFHRQDIPDRRLVNDVYTHDFEKLMDLTHARDEFRQELSAQPELREHWELVVEWKESARYNPAVTREQALFLYHACVARKHGILTWLKQRW